MTATAPRNLQGVEMAQQAVPDWMAPVFGLLTQLGSGWLLVLVLTVLYWTWVERQEDVLLLAAMILTGTGAYRGFKHIFALPRPNEPLLEPELVPALVRPLYELTAFSASYGFPSGHATVSTIAYLGLATILPIWTRRRRYLVAGGFVALIGFTRVVLGLHYVGDILAGIVLGVVVLYVGFDLVPFITDDSVTLMSIAALGTTAIYLLASAGELKALLTFSMALGFVGGWQVVGLARELTMSQPSSHPRWVAIRGALTVLTLGPLVVTVGLFPLTANPLWLGSGIAGIVVATGVVAPVARHSTEVRDGVRIAVPWT